MCLGRTLPSATTTGLTSAKGDDHENDDDATTTEAIGLGGELSSQSHIIIKHHCSLPAGLTGQFVVCARASQVGGLSGTLYEYFIYQPDDSIIPQGCCCGRHRSHFSEPIFRRQGERERDSI